MVVVQARKKFTNTTDLRTPRSNNDGFFSWQIAVILVLLFLIFVLLVTIFGLISRLHKVQRKIKLARYQADRDMNPNNIYDLYNEKPVKLPQSSKDCLEKNPEKSGDKFYNDIYCESPSSGFGSEVSKNDLDYVQDVEPMYASAQTVRMNKNLSTETIA